MSQLEKEKYENLQNEYKKIFSEYQKIKERDPHSPLIENIIEELDKKQKELTTTLKKFSS